MRYGHLFAVLLIMVFVMVLIGVFWTRLGPEKIDVTVNSSAGTASQSYAVPGNAGQGYYTQPLASQNAVVFYTRNGFSPATLTVPAGATVAFVNESSLPFRPASGPHPSHAAYPQTGSCAGIALDSCAPVPPGMAWSFKFDKIGNWVYHDHLNPDRAGNIIVQ